MVVDELPGLGVFAIAFHLAPEGPDHLGVASHTALTDVKVPSLQFQGGIGFYTADRRDVGLDHDRGHDLHDPPDQNGNGGQYGQLYGLAFQPAVEGLPGRPSFGYPLQGRGLGSFIRYLAPRPYGAHNVVEHHEGPEDVHAAPDGPHPVHGHDPLDGFHEIAVNQGAVRIEILPHQGLG